MMRRITCGMMGIGVAAGCAVGLGDDGGVWIDGYEFALIGDPGNRDTMAGEVPMFPDARIGGVEYEFLLSRTELTVGQYIEFVELYYPIYLANGGSNLAFVDFVGHHINAFNGSVFILPGLFAEQPTDMSWEYAARYINWLHHGKVNEEWAFETGVYDTSTFVQDDDGVWQHQAARSPGARFFFPTWDEWIKAGYWDPDKDDGAGGYWQFPNGSDVESFPGFPDEGGERNAGDFGVFPIAVGSYTDVTSPFGMYDIAGGYTEYTETPTRPDRLERRVGGGTTYFDTDYGNPISWDILGHGRGVGMNHAVVGVRLGAPGHFHPADMNGDRRVDYFDVARFVRWFVDRDERADLRLDGVFDFDDVRVFFGLMDL